MKTTLLILFLLASHWMLGQNARIGILDEVFIAENAKIDGWIKEEGSNLMNHINNSILDIQSEIVQNYFNEYNERENREGCLAGMTSNLKSMFEEFLVLENNHRTLFKYTDTTLIALENEYITWRDNQLQIAIDSIVRHYQYDIILKSEAVSYKTVVIEEEMQRFSKEVLEVLNKVPYSDFQVFSNSKKAECFRKIQQKVIYLPNPTFSYLYKTNVFAIILCSLSYLTF